MIEADLESKLDELIQQLKKQNSAKRNLYVSIVKGFGSALGATLVFGVAFAILFQIIRSIDYVPIINNILNSQALEVIMQQFAQPKR